MPYTLEQSQLRDLRAMTDCSEADSDLETATFAYRRMGEGGLGFVALISIGIFISVAVLSIRWIHKRYIFCAKRDQQNGRPVSNTRR